MSDVPARERRHLAMRSDFRRSLCVSFKLSVVLPVFNAHATLGRFVWEMIELLPEVTSPFELFVVDDGSTDTTADVLKEQAIRYPQVRFIRRPHRSGTTAAMHSALEFVHGDDILFCADGCPASAESIPKIWNALDRYDAAVGHLSAVPPQRRFRWPGSRTSTDRLNWAMLVTSRSIALDWSRASARENLLEWIERKGLGLNEVRLRKREDLAASLRASNSSVERLTEVRRIDSTPSTDFLADVNSPNFLDHLKSFASNE